MAVIYECKSVELLINGEKVDHGIVNLVYGPPKPSMAEYLARRELALDFNAQRLLNDEWGYRRPDVVWSASKWWREYRRYVPPRDKNPLPLP